MKDSKNQDNDVAILQEELDAIKTLLSFDPNDQELIDIKNQLELTLSAIL